VANQRHHEPDRPFRMRMAYIRSAIPKQALEQPEGLKP